MPRTLCLRHPLLESAISRAELKVLANEKHVEELRAAIRKETELIRDERVLFGKELSRLRRLIVRMEKCRT